MGTKKFQKMKEIKNEHFSNRPVWRGMPHILKPFALERKLGGGSDWPCFLLNQWYDELIGAP